MNFLKVLGIAIILILLAAGAFLYTTGLYTNYVNRIPYVRDLPIFTTSTPEANANVDEGTTPTSTPTVDTTTTTSISDTTTLNTNNGSSTNLVKAPVDEVTVIVADSVKTLDPYFMTSVHPDMSVSTHIWDGLTRLNSDLEVELNLAESQRLVNNFTWEFKLRPNVQFHNGEPVNAQAVHFSVERARSLPGSLETFANDIDLDEVKIIDDLTVHFVSHQAVANVAYHLAFLEILPPIYYSENGLPHLAKTPVGSGPYEVVGVKETGEIELEAIPDYWGGQAAITRVEFLTKPILNERFSLATSDNIAIVTDLPTILEGAWRTPETRLEIIESTQRLFIGMHLSPGSPFEVPEVRKALNYGVNADAIIDEWLDGYGSRYNSWVNPPFDDPDLEPWPYDPDQAKELLIQAGYSDGITTTLAIPRGLYEQEFAVAGAVAEQLAEIGIRVEVEEAEWPIYMRRLMSINKPPLFLLGLNSHANGLEDVKESFSFFSFQPY